MICPTPISIVDPNGSHASQRINVPCGKCGACRFNKRVEWTFRLKQEAKQHINSHFITLTYADENLPFTDMGVITLDKKDLQKFIKRLRKRQAQITDKKIRYYAVGEYGTNTERPHYHAIIFGCTDSDIINHSWNHGHIHTGRVDIASLHYVTKYHVNAVKDYDDDRQNEFATMSRRPGIGSNYLKHNKKWHRENMNTHVINDGYKQALPKYYKEKIFTENERKWLAQKNLETSRNLRDEKINRLEQIQDPNPDRTIFKRQLRDAQRIKDKAQEDNLF